ncbi:MAG: acyl-CoA desaturase, partial [Planctomycetota bacterium]
MPDLKTADAVVDDGAAAIIYPTTIPFLLVHLACIGMLWTGVTPEILLVAFVLYVVRMFGVTAGYHRYFSHRTYRTSRIGQFLLAFLAQSSAQRGAIWWAAQHRAHHKYSDTPQDVHSPRHRGFLYAHVGWIFSRRESKADLSLVSDLTRYPELVWLNKYHLVPAFVLAIGVTLIWGWAGLFGGFFLSTSLLYHGTFTINSLSHVFGSRRYDTDDLSRNNWFLALLTLGEGWHNNHHHFQASANQGFFWWEVDVSYYALCLMRRCGLAWDLKRPPEKILR